MFNEVTGKGNADVTFLGDEYEFFKSKANAIGKIMEMLLKCVSDFKPNQLMEKMGFDAQQSSFESALANVSADASEIKTLPDPLKTLLFKMSVSEFTVGQAHVKRQADISSLIETPLSNVLKTTVKESLKAQKSTDSARFNFDACRMRLKKASEVHKAKIEKEMADLKKTLDDSVASTLLKMKAVTETTELGTALLNLIKIQEEYHSTSTSTMTVFLPEAETLFAQYREAFEKEKQAVSPAQVNAGVDVAASPESVPVVQQLEKPTDDGGPKLV